MEDSPAATLVGVAGEASVVDTTSDVGDPRLAGPGGLTDPGIGTTITILFAGGTVSVLTLLTATPSRVAGRKRHLRSACFCVASQKLSSVAEILTMSLTRPSGLIVTRTVTLPSSPWRIIAPG